MMTIRHNLPMLGTDEHINNRIIATFPTMHYMYDDDELNRIIIQNCADDWHETAEQLYATTQYNYDPIQNYSMTETETRNINGNETAHTEQTNSNSAHTVADGTSNGDIKNDVHACEQNSNHTTGENTTTTDGATTSTGSSDSNSRVSKFGYNSQSPTATEQTDNNTNTDSRTTTADTTRAGSISDSVNRSKQCEQTERAENNRYSDTTDTTNTGSEQTDGTRTNQQTVTATLTRSGNIGVTTSQQMIQSERDIILDVLDWYIAKFITCFIWGAV